MICTESRICSALKCKRRGLMHVNVIRVPVAANRIESDHHVRSYFANVRHDSGGHLVNRMNDLGIRMLIVGLSRHARVPVPQEVDSRQPQVLGRAAELRLSKVSDRGVTDEVFWIDSTRLATRGAEQHNPVSASGVERKRAAHAKGFVVWVRQDRQQGSRNLIQCSLRAVEFSLSNGTKSIRSILFGRFFLDAATVWSDASSAPKVKGERMKFETLAIHAGQEPDPLTGAVMTPIYQTSTYVQDGVGMPRDGYEYSRTKNPTRLALEACVAALEGSAYGLAFASGMAATDTVLRLLDGGDHVVAGNDVYGGTYRLFDKVLRRFGLDFTYVDTTDPENVAEAMTTRTKLVWLETPTNPLLSVSDIRSIADIVHANSRMALLAVDNTFATPYLQRPLESGADIVVHSTTKYLGGHSDVVGGAVIVKDRGVHERLSFLQNAAGAVPGPMDSFLVLRGLKTLALRMDRHGRNAEQLAEMLAVHPKVTRLLYPFHASHPQHGMAKRQMRNGGGMISFVLSGGREAAIRVAEATKLFSLAESLGGVESLIEVPAAMTHLSTADSPLAVDPGLIRLSVGIENYDDLVEDLSRALAMA